MTPFTHSAKRAPAVYFVGRPFGGAEPYCFRLPCPPNWTPVRFAGRAPERRAKKAYFAALDAMRTGHADPEQAAKLGRMLTEASTRSARAVLGHLMRVMEAADRVTARGPVFPPPPAPLESAVATTTLAWAPEQGDPVERLAWPLEWLRTRGYIISKGFNLRWHTPRSAATDVTAASPAVLLELLSTE
jgi:hypothetical protein